MKRTYIAAALLACTAASPLWAADNRVTSGTDTRVTNPGDTRTTRANSDNRAMSGDLAGDPSSGSFSASQYQGNADNVRMLQERLRAKGYTVDVDGKWSPRTQAALQQYQRSQGYTNTTGTVDQQSLIGLGIVQPGASARGSVGASINATSPAPAGTSITNPASGHAGTGSSMGATGTVNTSPHGGGSGSGGGN